MPYALVAGSCLAESAASPPFTVKAGLFDQSRPIDLGLQAAEGAETFTVFRPSAATDRYSNGVVMTGFKGRLYCQWQSSKQDEDATDTWIAYSRSQDGVTWTAPMTLVPAWDKGYRSSGGWWVAGDSLVAYVNVWPSSVSPRGGYTEYMTSVDGLNWSAPVLTDMPDSRSKQSAGNLPDGTAFQAGNPVDTNVRIPLVVSLSKDGRDFDKAFVLRQGGGDLQSQRFTGKSKTMGYNYPKSMVWEGGLYVSYATNKEDVEYTRVPLASLSLNDPVSLRYSNSLSHDGALQVARGLSGVGKISLHNFSGEGIVQIFTPTGRLLFNGIINNGRAVSPMNFGCGVFVVAGSKSLPR